MVGRIKKGFTLVELSLALALIGVLSIIVILLISNAVSAYHRGLTLNQINTVGMALVDDMRAAVQASPGRFDYESECRAVYGDVNTGAGKECVDDRAEKFTAIKRKIEVKVGGGESMGSVPIYGAFCTGKYSYIWNSGYFFADEGVQMTHNAFWSANAGGAATFKYRTEAKEYKTVGDTIDSRFKILKVEDESRAVCKAAAGAKSGAYRKTDAKLQFLKGDEFDISCQGMSTVSEDLCPAVEEETIDTNIVGMNSGYGGVALYDLTVMPPASSEGTNNLFYTASFVLGTVQGGINVMAQGNYCAAPKDVDMASVENFDYCAINKFNFAAQATGG